ncbi:MAG: N-acetylmuramoyl-L-alanine amidase [Proteobacteria bacterium]|nr:N-acetylmuramoyl-L-alanine amidase [Pseudomonadota bacterium]MCP4918162.1 N-acetylmuramoyl-L-alanine amidase [Pseudomonadota bacterium]
MLIWLPVALAHGPPVPPSNTLTTWDAPLAGAGTRVGMIVETVDSEPVRVVVRSGSHEVQAQEAWRSGRVAVLFADVGQPVTTVRLTSPDDDRITRLDWDLFVPEPEPQTGSPPPPTAGVLPDELKAIGVTSRDDWGADATNCTSTEDDWYRMAVHHTAGSQEYGGSVQGSVRALQAYAMGSGSYCDIPYQFLVGHDGSLWEGRPFDYTSGATGGGNNDGNSAVCFLGCYDVDGCGTTHEATDEMIASANLLIHTFSDLESFDVSDDTVRGHRDWPGNSTACPGDLVLERFDELLEPPEPPGPTWAGSLVRSSTPMDGLEVRVGEPATVWLELSNDGSGTWTSNTSLAPLPRDEASALEAGSWLSTTRITGPDEDVAPGELGRFSFEVVAPTEGTHTQALGLVEEWVTWFADDGGPGDDELVLTVIATSEGPADTDSADPVHSDPGRTAVAPPGSLVPIHAGCHTAPLGGLWLALLLLRRREPVTVNP